MLEESQALLFAEQSIHKKQDGDYVFFDHSFALKEYKHRLASSHARCLVLEKDLQELRSKYEKTPRGEGILLTDIKIKKMENTNEQTQPLHSVEEEKKELLAKIVQLSRSCDVLELEKTALLEQLSLQSVSPDEKQARAIQLQQENANLKKKITEQDWLQDLVNEKNAEVSFLQHQLEQRIRNQHSLSQEKNELQARLQEIEEVNSTLQKKMNENEELLAAIQQELKTGKDQVVWQESQLREIKEQNEILNAAVADRQDEVMMLKEKLMTVEEKLGSMGKRFIAYKQILRRFYNELSDHIDAEAEQVPVIELGNADNERCDEDVVAGSMYPM